MEPQEAATEHSFGEKLSRPTEAWLTGAFGGVRHLEATQKTAEDYKMRRVTCKLPLADVLHGAGYATVCIGKWHLGHHPEFLPTRRWQKSRRDRKLLIPGHLCAS